MEQLLFINIAITVEIIYAKDEAKQDAFVVQRRLEDVQGLTELDEVDFIISLAMFSIW